MVKFRLSDVVCALSFIDQSGQSNAKGSFPTVAWKNRCVKGNRCRLRCAHCEVVEGHRIDGDYVNAVLVEEFNCTTCGIIEVANIADARGECECVTDYVSRAAFWIRGGEWTWGEVCLLYTSDAADE